MQPTLTEEEIQKIRPQVGVLRVIIAALVTGVFSFAAVIISLLGPKAFAPQFQMDVLPLTALAMAGGNVMLSFVMFQIMTRPAGAMPADAPGGDRSPQITATAQRLVSATIVASALLEGAAFFNLVIVQIGQGGLIHLCAAIALALLMFVRFPFSQDSFAARVERMLGE